jgi:hypothetical protein
VSDQSQQQNDGVSTDAPSTVADPRTGPQPPRASQPSWVSATLTSGRSVRIMSKRKGKHLELASRMAGSQASQMRFTMCMVAVCSLIAPDGGGEPKAMTIEELEELDANDVLELIGKVMGGSDTAAKGKDTSSPPST